MESEDSKRTRLPEPIEGIEVVHPALPKELEGLSVLHISDLHCRAFEPKSKRMQRLIAAIGACEYDLIAITGDLMDEPGDEEATMSTLELLAQHWRTPRLGVHTVLGNHDSKRLARLLRDRLPGIGLLENESVMVNEPRSGMKLRVVGLSWPEDVLGVLMRESPEAAADFTIVLAHMPGAIFACEAAKWPMVLAGHTHGGQIRISSRFAPTTSSDVPRHMPAGILRLGSTLCCVSRGIGDGVAEGLRLNCPWQIPLYRVRNGPLPKSRLEQGVGGVEHLRAW